MGNSVTGPTSTVTGKEKGTRSGRGVQVYPSLLYGKEIGRYKRKGTEGESTGT